jgi:enoyl-CoA hydratase/carnithine racemase
MTTAEALPVTWAIADGSVAVVTIDRPRRRNALNLEVKRLLTTAMLALDADPAAQRGKYLVGWPAPTSMKWPA